MAPDLCRVGVENDGVGGWAEEVAVAVAVAVASSGSSSSTRYTNSDSESYLMKFFW